MDAKKRVAQPAHMAKAWHMKPSFTLTPVIFRVDDVALENLHHYLHTRVIDESGDN